MNPNDLYEKLRDLNQKLNGTALEFTELHEEMIRLMEKNAELVIENQNLRERLKTINHKDGDSDDGLSSSRKNLEKLYHEGFHVCNDYYGKRREDGEECIFCTEIIYGRR